MAVAGLAAEDGLPGGMVVDDTECINTSFPGFEGLMESVRLG